MAYKITDLVDINKLKRLFERFSHTMGVAICLLEYPSMDKIISTSWIDICTNFFRVNELSNFQCNESDQLHLKHINMDQNIYIDKCLNGLVHGSIPIIIDGEILAILHTGQILFEIPDFEFFGQISDKYGFDKDAFFEALRDVPIMREEQYKLFFYSLKELADIIAEMGYINKKLIIKEEELTKSLDDLKVVNKQRERFLSRVSHDLRTPLGGISGFCQLLNMKLYGPLNEKQEEYVHLINNSAGFLLSLVNDLLDLAKVDAGTLQLNLEDNSIEDLLNNTLGIIKPQYEAKSVLLIVNNLSGVSKISVDKRKFEQILLNLLSNALKYSPENSKVEIKVEDTSNEYVKFSVIDNGKGIKKENIDKLYEEFYQVDSVFDQSQGGTGIGLAIFKSLVKLHGGQIGVDSEEGKGSCFWFTLPLNK